VFRRTICALTAWAAINGPINAQSPSGAPISERKSGPAEAAPSIPEANVSIPGTAPPLRDPSALRVGPTVTAAAHLNEIPPEPDVPPAPAIAPPPSDPFDPYAGPRIPKRKYKGPILQPNNRVWTRLELLVWSASGQHVPPAITTSPPGTPANFAGIIPNPGTEVLFPRDRTNNEFRGGFRGTAGYWLDVTAVARAVDAEFHPVKLNLMTLGNWVPHLHTHVVPRTKGDGLRGFFWPRHKYASADEASSIAALITKQLG